MCTKRNQIGEARNATVLIAYLSKVVITQLLKYETQKIFKNRFFHQPLAFDELCLYGGEQ